MIRLTGLILLVIIKEGEHHVFFLPWRKKKQKSQGCWQKAKNIAARLKEIQLKHLSKAKDQ